MTETAVVLFLWDACPFYPGKRYIDGALENPAGKPVEAVRPIVDDIDRRAQDLIVQFIGDSGN